MLSYKGEKTLILEAERSKAPSSVGLRSDVPAGLPYTTTEATASSSGQMQGLNVLSLDGGGIAGLSSLYILREAMSEVQRTARLDHRPEPYEYFDLIAGSGTGAIVAVMIGRLHMKLEHVIVAFSRLMSEATQKKSKKLTGRDRATIFHSGKFEKGLKRIIQKATGSENEMMMEGAPSQIKCKVVIYAVPDRNAAVMLPRAFRTYPANTNVTPDCSIWSALRASIAHPDLIGNAEIEDIGVTHHYVGGTIACSNPTAQALAEARTLYPGRLIASVTNVGAGYPQSINASRIPKVTLLPKSSPSVPERALNAIRMILADNQDKAKELATHFSRGPEVYLRLNVNQGVPQKDIDSWEELNRVSACVEGEIHMEAIRDRLEILAAILAARGNLTSTTADKSNTGVSDVAYLLLVPTEPKHFLHPTCAFRGRRPELNQVERYFANDEIEQHVFILHGIGGSGKTQTALKCAELTDQPRFEGSIFVDGSSRCNVEASLTKFAIMEGIGQDYTSTIRWIETRVGRWLMLFDNVGDPKTVVDYFPKPSKRNILITARHEPELDAHISQGKGSDCRLDGMDHEEAFELLLETAGLRKSTLEDTETKRARKLLKEFEYLALSIVQCGAFIWRTQCNFKQYHEAYMAGCREMSSAEGLGMTGPKRSSRQQSVHITLALNVQHIGAASNQLWKLLVFLHYSGISERIFRNALVNTQRYQPALPLSPTEAKTVGAVNQLLNGFVSKSDNGTWSSQMFLSELSQLVSLSLLSYDVINEAYCLHPVAQQLARATINYDEPNSVLNSSLLLTLSIDHGRHLEDRISLQAMEPHVHSIVGCCPKLSLNDAWQFIAVLKETGHRSEELETQVLAARTRDLGYYHPDTLESMIHLADLYYRRNKIPVAARLEAQILAIQPQSLTSDYQPLTLHRIKELVMTDKLLSDDDESGGQHLSISKTLEAAFRNKHLGVLCIIAKLALVYNQANDTIEGSKLEEQALDICRQQLGHHHPDTLRTMANLSSTYQILGQLGNAKLLRAEILDSCREALSTDDCCDMLRTAASLAGIYQKQGHLLEAKRMREMVMNTTARIFGHLDPKTLRSSSVLATTCFKRGEFGEAQRLQIGVLTGRQQVLGSGHSETVESMEDLASTYHERGRLEDAENLRARVLATRRTILGDEHPETLRSASALGSTYVERDRLIVAQELLIPTLKMQTRILGDGDPDTLKSMASLAVAHYKQGQLAEAAKLTTNSLAMRSQILGDSHPDTLKSKANLAAIYHAQGQLVGARNLAAEVLATRRRVLGEDHPDTSKSMSDFVTTYYPEGHLPNTEPLRLELLVARRAVLGDEHPDTVRSMSDLATEYRKQNRWPEAEELLVKVIAIQEDSLGEDHPETVESMEHLAVAYYDRSRFLEAEVLALKALNTWRRIFGGDHPNTIESMDGLAMIFYEQGRLKEAEALAKEALDIRSRVLGENHPDTLESTSDFLKTYYKKGRLADTESLNIELLRARRRVLGEQHPDTLKSMKYLLSKYYRGAQVAASVPLNIEVLIARRQILGKGHPDTLKAMKDFLTTWGENGRSKGVEELDLEVLGAQRRVLGNDHADTIESLGNLAMTYYKQGRLGEAETLMVEALATQTRVLGKDHPNTIKSMDDLATIYYKQGRLKNAERLAAEALATRRRVLGENHPDTRESMSSYFAKYYNVNMRNGRSIASKVPNTRGPNARKRVSRGNPPNSVMAWTTW